MNLLKNKNALILGVANERSIAWGITKELQKYGANIGLTYQSDLFKKRIDPLVQNFPVDFLQEMDVTNDDHYEKLKDVVEKKQAMYLGFGTAFLLGLFVETNIAGDWTLVYEFNLFGPIGMALFIVFVSYLIVKYHAFNIKLMGTQVLVYTLWIALCSTLFIRTIENARIVIAFTLILFLIVGIFLIRSVKKEVEQREKIEKLAGDLERANEKLKELDQLKSEFLSLATHQIRAPLTAIKGYSSMLLEGDYGVLPQKAADSAKTIMKSSQNLIDMVEDFLNISRIEQDRMVYEKTVFDIAELAKEVVDELKPNISNAELSLELQMPENLSIKVHADRNKIRQVILNVIDNAIKYTTRGIIKISIFDLFLFLNFLFFFFS